MVLNDIIALVEEKCDGRSLGVAKHKRWAQLAREEAVRSAITGGFHGIYFLYKEAKVTGGSVLGQARYQIPDDYVDDLAVWYDGTQLIKGDPGVLDVTAEEDRAGSYLPTWYAMRGLEFDIMPTPGIAGKEIKLFYNAMPEEITSATDEATYHDYFMDNWANLHVFGMAEYAADSLGGYAAAKSFRDRFNEEISRLTINNRRFWIKGTKMRLQNWDEFASKQRYLFPQFGGVYRTEETI
jgi:hypothetical protein